MSLLILLKSAAGSTQDATASQPLTVGHSAAAASTKPLDAPQTVTATQAVAAASTKPVGAAQTLTATQAAAATVTAAGISATAAQTVTVNQAASAAVMSPAPVIVGGSWGWPLRPADRRPIGRLVQIDAAQKVTAWQDARVKWQRVTIVVGAEGLSDEDELLLVLL